MIYVMLVINYFVQLITIMIIVKVFLSYFMAPYHPVRYNLDRIVEPLLKPIRRIVPPLGMLDFSPIILIVIIQLIARILLSLLASF